ncbi:MAG TPA: beta-propeller fold lactonase family protein [Rubricoccaceae bacterium]
MTTFYRAALALPFALALNGCDNGGPDVDDPTVVGSLYTMENMAGPNRVVVYDRLSDGSLQERARVGAGGNGSGPGMEIIPDPLLSQDALILSPDGARLFAVNAGSSTVASFTVDADGDLTLVEAEPAQGERPVSLTTSADGRRLYVVNAMTGGGAGSIAGFTVGTDGGLTAIPNSVRPLSGAAMTAPAQITMSPDGSRLVVTEKATNRIVTYTLGAGGAPGDPVVTPSAGVTPFGSMFTRNGTFISSKTNAPGGPLTAVPNGGTVSSYRMNADGTMTPVTSMAPAFGTASCWIEITPDDRYAYTTNTGSGTISGYTVGSNGSLTPLSQNAPLATLSVAGAAPLDMAMGDGFLYTVSGDAAGGDGTVSVHRLESDGRLTGVADAAAQGLPAFVTGLAAR